MKSEQPLATESTARRTARSELLNCVNCFGDAQRKDRDVESETSIEGSASRGETRDCQPPT